MTSPLYTEQTTVFTPTTNNSQTADDCTLPTRHQGSGSVPVGVAVGEGAAVVRVSGLTLTDQLKNSSWYSVRHRTEHLKKEKTVDGTLNCLSMRVLADTPGIRRSDT